MNRRRGRTAPRKLRRRPEHRQVARMFTPAVRARVRSESAALKLSPRAYLDTVTALAQAIRAAAFPEGIKNSETIVSIVKNPLLLQIAAGMTASVWQSMREAAVGAQAHDEQGDAGTRDAAQKQTAAPGIETPRARRTENGGAGIPPYGPPPPFYRRPSALGLPQPPLAGRAGNPQSARFRPTR